MLIKDTAQKIRAHRPGKSGMHPAVERRLVALGVDPMERAAAIALARDTPPAPRAPRPAPEGAGEALNLSLDPGDVRVRPLLQRAAMYYKNDALIADDVCPVDLVTERSAEYQIWGRDDDLEGPEDEIGPNGAAKEVTPTLSADNYSVRDRALKGFCSRDTELANPTLGVRARTIANVKNRLMLRREVRVADTYLTPGNYSGANLIALGGTANWDGGSTADPVDDILDAQEAVTGVDITDAVMSDIVWHGAQTNDLMRAILASQYDNAGMLRRQDFGLYFGITNVRITKAVKKNAAGARVRIWGSTAVWLGYVDRAPGALTFARTFRLKQGAGGWVANILPHPDAGINGGEYNRLAYSEDHKIVAPTYGVLITGAHS